MGVFILAACILAFGLPLQASTDAVTASTEATGESGSSIAGSSTEWRRSESSGVELAGSRVLAFLTRAPRRPGSVDVVMSAHGQEQDRFRLIVDHESEQESEVVPCGAGPGPLELAFELVRSESLIECILFESLKSRGEVAGKPRVLFDRLSGRSEKRRLTLGSRPLAPRAIVVRSHRPRTPLELR